MKKLLLKSLGCFLLLSLSVSVDAFAHKEWVHQWIIKEAYKLLKAETGITFPDLELYLGKDQYGLGDPNIQPIYPEFGDNSIVRGAYQEDVVDLVWNYTGIAGTKISATHFWDAQTGDNAHNTISVYTDVENAWEKARRYYFGRSEYPDFTLQREGFFSVINYPRGLFGLQNYTFKYPSLCDVYHNGSVTFDEASYGVPIYVIVYLGCLCWKINLNNAPYPLSDDGRKRFTYNIFGRILHLLGDMSVPAHTHSDSHGCGIPLYDGDIYELFMGNNYENGNCNNEHDDPSNTTQYGGLKALEQGGLLWEIFSMSNIEALRYLFFTTNRLAAHFPCFSETWGLQQPGNHFNSNGTNPYIESRRTVLGNPPINANSDVTSKESLYYAIRATATLLYWFQVKLNQHACLATLRLQNDNFWGIDGPPSTKTASFEAINDIQVGKNVFPSSANVLVGDYTVRNNSILQLTAGEDVLLKDGSSIQSGANFHAFISQPTCGNINSNNACAPRPPATRTGPPVEKPIYKNNRLPPSPLAVTVMDTTVQNLSIYTDSTFTLDGSINDTIRLSKYLAVLWDSSDVGGDTVVLNADKILDSTSIVIIRTSAVGVLYPNKVLREGVDTNCIVEVHGNGQVYIYADVNSSTTNTNSATTIATIQVYPNPVGSTATIEYYVPYQTMVSIELFNDIGEPSGVLVSRENKKKGNYSVQHNFSENVPGTYYVRMQYGNKVKTINVVVDK